jgi:Xaa-Pro aminopeptidase
MFETKIYVQRRERLKKTMAGGILLFPGNAESPMNYADNTYHFRQDSSFLYFFGLDQPNLTALIDLDENREIIFGDELTIDDIVWMGTQPTLRARAETVGVYRTEPTAKLADYLSGARAQNRVIHYLPPYRANTRVFLAELLGLKLAEVQQRASLDFIKAVIALRNIKQEEEIVEIEKAVTTSVRMHRRAMTMAAPGLTEAEIAAAVHEVALTAGGNLAFPIIATINGQTLHNHYHGNVLKKGDLFLLDAGAETALHYGGDLSSTVPVDKTFTTRQKEIYRIAFDAHQAAVSMLRPGIRFKEIHLAACRVIASGLRDLGLMTGDVDEAVAAGAHAMFFPCGLGHMMGLDIHDMESLGEVYVGWDGEAKSTQFGLKSLRLGRELVPGFVLTIEPGIYFIPELMDLWQKQGQFASFINYQKLRTYRDFGGLRNEENFLISADGCRRLGEPLPKTIEAVEGMRA